MPWQAIDRTGQRYGRLMVLARAANAPGHLARWRCRCDCGRETTAYGIRLGDGRKKSCGCLQPQVTRERSLTHGATVGRQETREYAAWTKAKGRCFNQKAHNYAFYGGRGIMMCDRWATSFEAFLADVGPAPSERHTLERINNDGHYEAGNVRWATKLEQARNRRTSLVLAFNGERRTLAEWAERIGIRAGTLQFRLSHGWPIERALTTPVDTRKSHHT